MLVISGQMNRANGASGLDLHAMERAMANPTLPSIEKICQLVSYDAATGDLTWKARDGLSRWNTRFAGKPALNYVGKHGYKVGALNSTSYYAHRICAAIVLMTNDIGEVDHINGIKTDNRAENLRVCSHSDNMRNAATPVTNTSGCCGVSFDKSRQKWFAYIKDNGKMRFLGRFLDFEKAVKARKMAERSVGYHDNHGRLRKDL